MLVPVAEGADPGRWRLTHAAPLKLEYYQGVASDPARRLFFSGFFVGVYRTTPAGRETRRVEDAIPAAVRFAEGYDHIGDIAYDRSQGGRVLLPLECYTPGAPDTNPCDTGAFGILDPGTLAWRGYARLDPRAIPKAMWVAVHRGLAWTQARDDLLAFRLRDVRPGARDVHPVRRLVGAAAGGATGGTFIGDRLFLASGGDPLRMVSVDVRTGDRRLEIERPVTGESEGLDTVRLSGGELQWMVGPVVAGRQPTYRDSTLLSFAPVLPPRLRVSVAPERLRAGRPARLRVRVTRRGEPASGARVAGLGARARAGRDGVAVLRLTPRRRGRFELRAALALSRPGAVAVTVLARTRRSGQNR